MTSRAGSLLALSGHFICTANIRFFGNSGCGPVCGVKRTPMLRALTSACDTTATTLVCRPTVVSRPDATADCTYLSRFFDGRAKAADNLRRQHGFPLALKIATAAPTSIGAKCLYFAKESWRPIKKLHPGPSGEDADAGRSTSRCRISYPAPARAGIGRHRGRNV
jgi:hypothetical protein